MSDCLYPGCKASTSYRYGCRCDRCRIGNSESMAEWQRLRLIGPLHGPRRVGRSPIEGVVKTCELCAYQWVSYGQAGVRSRICAHCLSPWTGRMKVYHLSAEQTLRMIACTHCEMCGAAFGSPRSRSTTLHVDHDRGCCSRNGSCGRCVRGFVCAACNVTLGFYERALRLDLAMIDRYLGRAA